MWDERELKKAIKEISSRFKEQDRIRFQQYIYLIRCGKYFKIGISGNPLKRAESIQTSTPYKTELLYAERFENATEIEKELHQLLKDKRVRGEWFELQKGDFSKIQEVFDNNE